MADTSGLVKIEDAVDRFMFRYKVPQDDYAVYLENALAFLSEISVHHGVGYKEEKIAVDSLGFMTMPTDLLDIVDIYIPRGGSIWYFTRNDKLVTTTTTVDGSETFSTTYGEGTNIPDAQTVGLGAVGGINDYYYTPIWADRRVLIKGITSANVTLRYKSTGIDLSGITYIPALAENVMVAKLKSIRAYLEGKPLGEQQMFEQQFDREIAMFRRAQMPSMNEVKDVFRSATTQAPMRYE